MFYSTCNHGLSPVEVGGIYITLNEFRLLLLLLLYYLRRKEEFMLLGLSVCLSVCPLDYSKSYEQILTKFFEGMGRSPQRNFKQHWTSRGFFATAELLDVACTARIIHLAM